MAFALQIRDLKKEFRTPFLRRRVDALKGVTLDVEEGEVFGYLGPNGAGKTTTIRILMNLVHATAGELTLLGKSHMDRKVRYQVGFLPEAPYFYEYLTVEELLHMTGKLFGIDKRERSKRIEKLIEEVNLSHATKRPLRKFSKGMLQRAGLAQALINQPKFVVFDEPMSGLDPLGRSIVRKTIRRLRKDGTTVFFCSHVLADVESLCDRVSILHEGELIAVDRPSTLVATEEYELKGTAPIGGESDFDTLGGTLVGKTYSWVAKDAADANALRASLLEKGFDITTQRPKTRTLEEVFVERVEEKGVEAFDG